VRVFLPTFVPIYNKKKCHTFSEKKLSQKMKLAFAVNQKKKMGQFISAAVLSIPRDCEVCGVQGTSRTYNITDPWSLALCNEHWLPIDNGTMKASTLKLQMHNTFHT
jgi:hypothetical protein